MRGSNPIIEIFDDRIEISSPGRLLPSKNVDRLIGTNPESRNEILASALRRYYICEERGSGFVKTVIAIEMFHLPPLKLMEGDSWFKSRLCLAKKYIKMTSQERLGACYQHAVLKHLSNDVLTNKSLRERLKLSDSNSNSNSNRNAVSKLIKTAVEANRIKQNDPSNKSHKFSEYVPYWA